MNVSELRAKNAGELKQRLMELYREHFNLRVQRATGQLGNPSRFRALRKDIARIKTVLSETKQAQT